MRHPQEFDSPQEAQAYMMYIMAQELEDAVCEIRALRANMAELQ